ncbi:MAG: hypothetical protein ACM3W4_06355 [Ignavibacteriales bacterium]
MRWLMLGLALVFLPTAASAKYVQTVKVRYATDDGASPWYSVDVTFLTGTELNRATRTFNYGGFDKYAVIFWDQNEASVIKLDGFFACGTEFTQSCLRTIGNMDGTDQEGRGWEICAHSLCL